MREPKDVVLKDGSTLEAALKAHQDYLHAIRMKPIELYEEDLSDVNLEGQILRGNETVTIPEGGWFIWPPHDHPKFKYWKSNNTPGDDSPNELYLGVELELDQEDLRSGDEKSEARVKFLSELYHLGLLSDKIYVQCEPEIGKYGVEITSMPATLQAHVDDTIPWEEILQIAKKYHLHAYPGCGLHIHINRGYFTWGTERTEAGWIYLCQKFYQQLSELSRRDGINLVQYAHDFDVPPMALCTEGMACAIAEWHKKKTHTRGFVVNMKPKETLECRLFQSTTDIDELIGALQLVFSLAVLVEARDWNTLKGIKFKDIIQLYDFKTLTKMVRESELAPLLEEEKNE